MMATLLLKLSVSAIGTMEFVAYVELLQCLKVVIPMQKNCTPLRKGEVSYKKNFEM